MAHQICINRIQVADEYPSQMEICISERCNLDCNYCFINKINPRELSMEQARRGIDLFLNMGPKKKTITFNSGEPLLKAKKLSNIIVYALSKAKERNIKLDIIVTTNGLLLNRRIFNFLSNKAQINISMDGRKESHDAHRLLKSAKKCASFERIQKNTKHLPNVIDVQVILVWWQI